jgi:transcriptional pleiotropic repressor
MSLDLLDKTRKINWLIIEDSSQKLDFNTFCGYLSDIMNVNVVLFSRKGKVLGVKEQPSIPSIPKLKHLERGMMIDNVIKDRFMSILSTHENINLTTMGMDFEGADNYHAMISPVKISKNRMGSLIVYNNSSPFTIDDIILLEHSITLIGLAMRISKTEENLTKNMKTDDVSIALSSLSMLELKALISILNMLNGQKEGRIVSSKLANELGITRTVIINALKKCESAGILCTKSLGMKGTMITITNDLLCTELVQSYYSVN